MPKRHLASARRLVQVGRRLRQAEHLTYRRRCTAGAVFSKPLDVIRRVKPPLMLAAVADGQQDDAAPHQVAERSGTTRILLAGGWDVAGLKSPPQPFR